MKPLFVYRPVFKYYNEQTEQRVFNTENIKKCLQYFKIHMGLFHKSVTCRPLDEHLLRELLEAFC